VAGQRRPGDPWPAPQAGIMTHVHTDLGRVSMRPDRGRRNTAPLPGGHLRRYAIGDRQRRDLRLSALCPIRVQKGLRWARFRWSAPDGATPSGAVSAGSNPAGGTGQRHKFEHQDNLDASRRWVCDPRLRNGAVIFAPHALPRRPPLPLRRWSWHMAISAYEAVALLSQVGTPSPTHREHNGLASTAQMRQVADSARAAIEVGALFGARRMSTSES
jgi:hypothetical protein